MVVGGFEWLLMVLGDCGCCGWLWMVVDGYG